MGVSMSGSRAVPVVRSERDGGPMFRESCAVPVDTLLRRRTWKCRDSIL
jgi:hypothetical protein